MKVMNMLTIGALSLSLVACSSSSSSKETKDDSKSGEIARYTTVVNSVGNNLLLDNNTSLMWTNNAGDCFAGIVDTDTESCNDLVSGEFDDWRYPTQVELSNLIISTNTDESVLLEYANPNCVMGTASDGWVKTHNNDDIGALVTERPGNSGLRCVRDVVDNSEVLKELFEGTTQYTVNTKGVVVDRVFNVDGTYTGSGVLPNGNLLENITGTYSIDGNVLTLNRESPQTNQFIVTYKSHQDGMITMSSSMDGAEPFPTVFFTDKDERDNYTFETD